MGLRLSECNDNRVEWIKNWGAGQRVQSRGGWSQRLEGARRGVRVGPQVLVKMVFKLLLRLD